MGRYDFRPRRVYQATTQLLATERISRRPPWYDVVGNIPPPEILVRTQPVQQARRRGRGLKASKAFAPQPISYPEDKLRRTFYSDHPWELARPRMVLENDGKDAKELPAPSIRQPGRPLNGESVIQRQMWLMKRSHMTERQAYDKARQEFYHERLREDVERRVAQEEAYATSAYFGMSSLEVGMELENKAYERWRIWAEAEVTRLEQARAAGSATIDSPSEALGIENPEKQAEPEDGGAVAPTGALQTGA